LLRIWVGSICAASAALAMGFTLGTGQAHRVGPATAGTKADRLAVAALDTTASTSSRLRLAAEPHASALGGMRLASLETSDTFDLPPRVPFSERFLPAEPSASFDQRFSVTGVSAGNDDDAPIEVILRPTRVAPPARPEPREAARAPYRKPATKLAMLTPASLQLPARNPVRESVRPDIDSRTAIYDITARVVYLPNGRKLEAHSGLGEHMDDPRFINLKGRGPTPPNVYRLVMREKLFHGVRAIRLVPQDDGKMFGRDGMLAHTYMLGPNGQSNGCVSFSDYPAFLSAYLAGDVDRLVVVERLQTAPDTKPGPGWLADALADLFKPLQHDAGAAPADGHNAAMSYR